MATFTRTSAPAPAPAAPATAGTPTIERLRPGVRDQFLATPNKRGRTPTLKVIQRGISMVDSLTQAQVDALGRAVETVTRYEGWVAVEQVKQGLDGKDRKVALKGLQELIDLGKGRRKPKASQVEEAPKDEPKPKAKRERKPKAAKVKVNLEELTYSEVEQMTAPKEPSAKELVLMALKATQDANVALTTALTAYLDAN